MIAHEQGGGGSLLVMVDVLEIRLHGVPDGEGGQVGAQDKEEGKGGGRKSTHESTRRWGGSAEWCNNPVWAR